MLPSILRHENVARIEDDVLLIGDRRKFPFRREFYKAYDASDAACAIRMMVTQGGGPLETALQAMVLTARKFGKNMDELRKAGDMLASARKTNTTMKRELASLLDEFETMGSRAFADAAQELVNSRLEEYDEKYLAMAECGCRLIKDGDGILLSLPFPCQGGRKEIHGICTGDKTLSSGRPSYRAFSCRTRFRSLPHH